MATDTTPDAQVGTQEMEIGLANPREETQLVNRVLGANDLSSKWLASRTGLSESYISRVLSGAYPVTVGIFQALWSETNDPSLLQFICASSEDVHIVSSASDPEHVLALALDLLKQTNRRRSVGASCATEHRSPLLNRDQLKSLVDGSMVDKIA